MQSSHFHPRGQVSVAAAVLEVVGSAEGPTLNCYVYTTCVVSYSSASRISDLDCALCGLSEGKMTARLLS